MTSDRPTPEITLAQMREACDNAGAFYEDRTMRSDRARALRAAAEIIRQVEAGELVPKPSNKYHDVSEFYKDADG